MNWSEGFNISVFVFPAFAGAWLWGKFFHEKAPEQIQDPNFDTEPERVKSLFMP
ncbi:hypothetical protein ACNFZX_25010 (plasmid) [Escherichia coli]